MKRTKIRKWLCTAAALILSASLCGAAQVPVLAQTAEEEDQNVLTVTAFLDHPEYDGTVTNGDEAMEAIYSMMPELGVDEVVDLVYHDEIRNADDTVFYSFEQVVGGLQVYGSTVKLIADSKGTILGVLSSLVTGLQETPETAWEITQEEAEQIVAEGHLDPGARVLPEVTEQTILTLDTQGALYVWVIYTNNVSPKVEKAYLAHYVTGAGEYLYSLPVTAPGNEDALRGSVSAFAFEGFREDTWTGMVTDSDGLEREITVPIMVDEETGVQYLGDLQRKIICADYADFDWEDTLTPVTSTDGTWVNNEVITYEMIIRVWDFYDSVGWHGPDGSGTPVLILMNYIDKEGNPIDNAYYGGLVQGFQLFAFNDAFGDGSCSDIVGHEFTHCVTQTSLIFDVYQNDMGAINEGISDIMGNLIEMMFGDSPGGEWLFSERHSNGIIRSMKDPHACGQPEYTWDLYYLPNLDNPSEDNDLGGVHRNDSIISQISYKLDQAGMPVEDQFYYWLNVDMAQIDVTDYPMMAELLPFVLDFTGYSEYKEALQKAIEDTRMAEKELPEEIAPEIAIATMDLPFGPAEQGFSAVVTFNPVEDELTDQIIAWPIQETTLVAAPIPEGDYIVVATLIKDENNYAEFIATEYGWIPMALDVEALAYLNKDEKKTISLHFEGGKITQLETDSMANALTN